MHGFKSTTEDCFRKEEKKAHMHRLQKTDLISLLDLILAGHY